LFSPVRTLASKVFVISVAAILTVTSLVFFIEYWVAQSQQDRTHILDIQKYLERVLPGLVRAAYQVNEDYIFLWLESIQSQPGVVAAAFADSSIDIMVGDPEVLVDPETSCSLLIRRDISNAAFQGLVLGSGELRICYQRDELNAVSLFSVVFTRPISFLAIILSAFVISLAVYRIVVSPLKSLSAHLRSGLPIEEFTRDRSWFQNAPGDEFDILQNELLVRTRELFRERAAAELSFPEISDGIAQTSSGFRILRGNKTFFEILGADENLTHLDEFLGSEIVSTPGIHQHVSPTNDAVLEIKTFKVGTSELDAGYVYFIRDIEEQKRAEEHRIQESKMSALGTLASGVAHDFNNILAAILANIELVSETEKLTQDSRDRISSVVQYTERGASLAGQLLSFARQRAQNTTVFAANLAVENLESIFNPLTEKSIHLATRIETNHHINVDRGLLETALLNLMINSKHALKNIAGAKIRLSVREINKDGQRYVQYEVTDNGEGIPPDELAKIREPFFTTKRQSEGSGLGLAMVTGFAEQFGGSIEFESSVGKGTTAKLILPIFDGPAIEYPLHQPELAIPDESSEKLLVVEDEVALREIICLFLRKSGFKVSGIGSLEELTKEDHLSQDYDLVICDLLLEDCTGADIVEKFHASGRKQNFVLMSGNFPLDLIECIERFGKFRQIDKPFRNSDLIQVVRVSLKETRELAESW